MLNIDLKKDLKTQYGASAKAVQRLTVPAQTYLMADGRGDPNTASDFRENVPALFTLAYALRAAVRAATGTAYTVMPLEGLWAVGEGGAFDDRATWVWTLLILQPSAVDAALFEDVKAQTMRKKSLPALDRVRLERFEEGDCVQMLHVGPFSTEPATIARLENYCRENGLDRNGRHHEIYLSRIQPGPQARMKTILRQPIKPT